MKHGIPGRRGHIGKLNRLVQMVLDKAQSPQHMLHCDGPSLTLRSDRITVSATGFDADCGSEHKPIAFD